MFESVSLQVEGVVEPEQTDVPKGNLEASRPLNLPDVHRKYLETYGPENQIVMLKAPQGELSSVSIRLDGLKLKAVSYQDLEPQQLDSFELRTSEGSIDKVGFAPGIGAGYDSVNREEIFRIVREADTPLRWRVELPKGTSVEVTQPGQSKDLSQGVFDIFSGTIAEIPRYHMKIKFIVDRASGDPMITMNVIKHEVEQPMTFKGVEEGSRPGLTKMQQLKEKAKRILRGQIWNPHSRIPK